MFNNAPAKDGVNHITTWWNFLFVVVTVCRCCNYNNYYLNKRIFIINIECRSQFCIVIAVIKQLRCAARCQSDSCDVGCLGGRQRSLVAAAAATAAARCSTAHRPSCCCCYQMTSRVTSEWFDATRCWRTTVNMAHQYLLITTCTCVTPDLSTNATITSTIDYSAWNARRVKLRQSVEPTL